MKYHPKLKYKYQLVLYFVLVLSFMALVFTIYIVQRNKDYSFKTLRDSLIKDNEKIYETVKNTYDFFYLNTDVISLGDTIRVTLIDTSHNMIYDNSNLVNITDDCEWELPELVKAEADGEGTALRFSVPLRDEYLYYAKKYDRFYIRTGVKFHTENIPQINDDNQYLYVIIFLVGLLFASLAFIIRKLTRPLAAFNKFADVLRSPNKDFSNIKFPNNEFGEVGKKIAELFDQLEKTKTYKQQMSDNIAHELKTPITGIMTYLETILNTEEMTPQQVKYFVEKAYNQSKRLTSLVKEVSMLNKLDAGTEQFPIEEIYFSKIFAEVKEELGYKLQEANIEFNPCVSKDLKMYGCRQLIYSLFKNLVDNSIEHGGNNITITIWGSILQLSGDSSYRVKFTYKDTGKGIPEKDLPRIFERFYRIDKGRTRRMGGSGLGLAIVKNAVLYHRGTISAENAPEGGIIFKFDLLSLDKLDPNVPYQY